MISPLPHSSRACSLSPMSPAGAADNGAESAKAGADPFRSHLQCTSIELKSFRLFQL